MSKVVKKDRLKEAAENLADIQRDLDAFTKPMAMGYPKQEEQWRTGYDMSDEAGLSRREFYGGLKKVGVTRRQQEA